MRIELLYFEGCPGYEALARRLPDLLAGAGLEAAVELVEIDSLDAALQERFLGSPTVRVDGVDVESAADGRDDYGMKCRLYATPEGLRRTPPDQLILDALEAGR